MKRGLFIKRLFKCSVQGSFTQHTKGGEEGETFSEKLESLFHL